MTRRNPLRALARRRERRRLAAASTAVLLAVGAVLWAVLPRGVTAQRVALEDSAAWLVSSRIGQAALVDGASDEVVTQVRVADGGADLAAAPSAADVYVADSARGNVVRVDGATYDVSKPVALAQPGQRLTVFPGGADLFAFASPSGLVTTADAATLRVRGRQALVSSLAPGGGTVDGNGRLWLVDSASGDLVWLDHDGTVGRRQAAVNPAGTQLVVAAGQAALVDGQAVRPLGADGTLGAATCLAEGTGDTAATVAGSPSHARVYTASGRRGVLLVSDLARHSCDGAVDLGAAGHSLGTPREAAGRVFVPDLTTGTVYVVDLGAPKVIPVKVLPTGRAFELVPAGGFMFYNDPASELAGVIRLDGSTEPIEKYDPADPARDLAAAGDGDNGSGTGPGGSGSPGSSPSVNTPPTGQTTTTPAVIPPTTGPVRPTTPTRPTGPTTPPPPGTVLIEQSAREAGVGQDVTLRVVAVGGGQLSAVQWAFGDSASGSGALVHHRWTAAGDYTVSADVTLANGGKATPRAQVTVTAVRPPTTSPPPTTTGPPVTPDTGRPEDPTTTTPVPERGPSAQLKLAAATAATQGDDGALQNSVAVTADASGSRPGSTPIRSYAFDFAGSFGAPSSGATAQHTYDRVSGPITVRVRVTDEAGLTALATATLQPPTSKPPSKATLTVEVEGSGGHVSGPDPIYCPDTCSATLDVGTEVTLTAYPYNGTFDGWTSGPCAQSTNQTCTFTLTSALTVKGGFSPDTARLTVQVTGSGTVTDPNNGLTCVGDNTCSEDVALGTSVVLNAEGKVGYRFDGFSNNCPTGVSSTSCAVTIDGETTVTAVFSRDTSGTTFGNTKPLTVTLSANGYKTTPLTADVSASAQPGTRITFTATAPGDAGVAQVRLEPTGSATCSQDGVGQNTQPDYATTTANGTTASVTLTVPSCPAGWSVVASHISVRAVAVGSTGRTATTSALTFGTG